MPSLSFDGETHDEIVQQVRHWLAAHDASEEGGPKPADLVNQTAALTKDAFASSPSQHRTASGSPNCLRR